jgi:8-oxo-dGTP diphosphatase
MFMNCFDPNSTPEPGKPVLLVVAVALVDVDGRVLLAQRPEGKSLAGLWEFPGGKIDPAESHIDALRREMREELAADVDVHELVFATTHAYPERTVELFFYRCALRQRPQPQLGQEMRWVRRSELSSLGFPPADEDLINLLRERRSFSGGTSEAQ